MVIGINTVTYLDQASLIEAGDGRESQAMFLDQEIPYLNLRNHLKTTKYDTQIYSIVDQNTSRHVKQSQNISESPNVTIEYIDSPITQIGFHLLRNGELIDKIIGTIDPK